MDKNLLIVVGSGRSGTTYLSKVLKKNLGFGLSTEPKFIVKLLLELQDSSQDLDEKKFNRILHKVYNSHSFNVLRNVKSISTNYDEFKSFVKKSSYEYIVYGALDYIAHIRGNKKRGFKDPNALKYIGLLSQTFPESKFIHIYRDGRDVAKSTLNFKWGGNNIYVNAVEWAKYTKAGRVQGQKLGNERYLELKFEDMVLNPESATAKMMSFLNITDEKSMCDLNSYFKSTLDEDKIYKWKSSYSEKELQLFEKIAGQTLKEFGYESVDYHSGISIFLKCYYICHDYIHRVFNVLTRNLEKLTKNF